MEKTDDGGAAFPRSGFWPVAKEDGSGELVEGQFAPNSPEFGMTLLDHFAGCALNGLIAMTADGPNDRRICVRVANAAYAYAQEMLAARARVMKLRPMCECDDDGQDGGGAASKQPGDPLTPPPGWKEWDLPGPPPAG